MCDRAYQLVFGKQTKKHKKKFWRRSMVKPITKDIIFLAQKSKPATPEDHAVAADLLDTLRANAAGCVGMAANMIGVSKRIIAFYYDGDYMVLYNPEILRSTEPYQAEEGCLSLDGQRQAKRFKNIQVRYQDENFQTRRKSFTGFTAQIIQHEVDHCNGIII